MSILNQRTEEGVLVVELNRVGHGNALNRALQSALAQTWDAFEADDALSVAVVHGAPNVFSIGHDVAELAADTGTSPIPLDGMFPLHLSKPVIAAIAGPCYGLGFELALACDLRVATEAAGFGFVDPHLFVPYRVASVLLPRMAWLGTSLELILSGRLMSGAEMRALGLVSELTSDADPVRRAIDIAHAMRKRISNGDFRKQRIWRLSGVPIPAAMQMARERVR